MSSTSPLQVPCQFCGAQAGEFCVVGRLLGPDGFTNRWHTKRREAYAQKRAAELGETK